jgi:hypothetical protein
MRIAHFQSSLFGLLALLSGLAVAQTGQAQSAPAAPVVKAADSTSPVATRREKLGQTIRIEDGGATIDETRLGGETQSILVQPKGGMPRYEVLPPKGDASGGTRVWKVLGF